MSKKKFIYRAEMTEDEMKKELYREIWYTVRSDIRKSRRPAGVINFNYSYCGTEVTDYPGGSFIGVIDSSC